MNSLPTKFYRLSKEDLAEFQTVPVYSSLSNISVFPSWFNSLKELGYKIEEVCLEENIPFPRINQIKSKFGTLRFYYIDETHNIKLKKLVEEYHSIINNICECCGDKIKAEPYISSTKLVLSLCPVCAALDPNMVSLSSLYN